MPFPTPIARQLIYLLGMQECHTITAPTLVRVMVNIMVHTNEQLAREIPQKSDGTSRTHFRPPDANSVA